jgi:hypothetical protein
MSLTTPCTWAATASPVAYQPTPGPVSALTSGALPRRATCVCKQRTGLQLESRDSVVGPALLESPARSRVRCWCQPSTEVGSRVPQPRLRRSKVSAPPASPLTQSFAAELLTGGPARACSPRGAGAPPPAAECRGKVKAGLGAGGLSGCGNCHGCDGKQRAVLRGALYRPAVRRDAGLVADRCGSLQLPLISRA